MRKEEWRSARGPISRSISSLARVPLRNHGGTRQFHMISFCQYQMIKKEGEYCSFSPGPFLIHCSWDPGPIIALPCQSLTDSLMLFNYAQHFEVEFTHPPQKSRNLSWVKSCFVELELIEFEDVNAG